MEYVSEKVLNVDNNILIIGIIVIALIGIICFFMDRGEKSEQKIKIPKIIWIYWHEPIEKAPEIVQICINIVKKLNYDYEINILNQYTYKNYVNDASIINIMDSNLQNNFKSDLLRLYLIYTYGGIYMDASILPFQSYDWVLDTNKDVFMYKNVQHTTIYTEPVFETWLIASVKGNSIIKLLMDTFHNSLINGVEKSYNEYINNNTNYQNFYNSRIKHNSYYLIYFVMIHTLSKYNLHDKIDYLDCTYDKYPCKTILNNENLKDIFLKEYSEKEYLEIIKTNKFVKLVRYNREYILQNNIKYIKNSLIDYLLNFYDTYNGEKWNNYRLGDIIKGYIYCRYMNCYNKKDNSYYKTCNRLNYISCEGVLKKDKDYLTNININYTNSIGSKYVDYVGFPNSFKHEDINIIKKIFCELDYKKPGKNTLLIHLRLGDTIYDTNYSYNINYYKKLLERIKNNKNIKKIDIITGSHFNVNIMKSSEYINNIKNIFIRYYPIEIIITKNPDKDFYYMCHSNFFAKSGGGFSEIITKYLQNENKFIYYKDKVILITQYYEPNNTERMVEIKECLINNNNNKLIDEIHLFIEKDYNFDFIKNNKIKFIKTDKQLSFKKAFDYSNTFDNNHIMILANSDIYFDESLQNIHNIDFNKTFYALNRYDLDKNNNIKIDGNPASQDTWIWKPPFTIIQNENNSNDYFDKNDGIILGVGSCDNRILKVVEDSGYKIRNICKEIKTVHNHKNDYRLWTTDPNKLKYTNKYRKNGVKSIMCEN